MGPASPVLQGRFLTTGPPGKSQCWLFLISTVCLIYYLLCLVKSPSNFLSWCRQPLLKDSCYGLTENNKILQSNYPSIKKISKLKKKKTNRGGSWTAWLVSGRDKTWVQSQVSHPVSFYSVCKLGRDNPQPRRTTAGAHRGPLRH